MPENSERENAFISVCRDHRLLDQEQLDECLDLRDQALKEGAHVTLAQIAVTQGYLKKQQAENVFKMLENERKTPMKIGGFEILEKIGSGGMGTVFKARQVSMNRMVALKVLPPKLKKNKSYIERFKREAQAAAQLNHPNIVHGIDAGEEQGFYYFAMEYVDGESLGEVLERESPLDELRALEITRDVALALEHAAEINVVHRDIKPGNILLTRKGEAKLSDLGLAKVQQKQASFVTQTGFAVGTPHYISPEQAQGKPHVDTRADIYSLGVTLYHMLAGDVPFPDDSPLVVMTKHLNNEFPPLEDRNPSVSRRTHAILARMTAKKITERYQSATDLLADIAVAMRELEESRKRSSYRIATGDEISAAAATLPDQSVPKDDYERPSPPPGFGSAARAPSRRGRSLLESPGPDVVDAVDAVIDEAQQAPPAQDVEEVADVDAVFADDEEEDADGPILRQDSAATPAPIPAIRPEPQVKSESAIDLLRTRIKMGPDQAEEAAGGLPRPSLSRVKDWLSGRAIRECLSGPNRVVIQYAGIVVLAIVLFLVFVRLFTMVFSSEDPPTSGNGKQPAPVPSGRPGLRPGVPTMLPVGPSLPPDVPDNGGTALPPDVPSPITKTPDYAAPALPHIPEPTLPENVSRKLNEVLVEAKLKADLHRYGDARGVLANLPEDLRRPDVKPTVDARIKQLDTECAAYVNGVLLRADEWVRIKRFDKALGELRNIKTGIPGADARIMAKLTQVETHAMYFDIGHLNLVSATARCNVKGTLSQQKIDIFLDHIKRVGDLRDKLIDAIRAKGEIPLPIVGAQKLRFMVPPVTKDYVTVRAGVSGAGREVKWEDLTGHEIFASLQRILDRKSGENNLNLAILAAYAGLEDESRKSLVQAQQLKAPGYEETKAFIENKFREPAPETKDIQNKIVSKIDEFGEKISGGQIWGRYAVAAIAVLAFFILLYLVRKMFQRK